MFRRDPCAAWRRLLSDRSDGRLTVAQFSALDDHVRHCDGCAAAAAADAAVRTHARTAPPPMDGARARAMDDRVIAMLRHGSERTLRALWSWLLRDPAVPGAGTTATYRYLAQIACGAVGAAVVTAICLFPAFPSAYVTRAAGAAASGAASARSAGANNAPVPLETLLQSQTPRAALLWTAPAVRQSHRDVMRHAAPPVHMDAPIVPRASGSPRTERHSALPESIVQG